MTSKPKSQVFISYGRQDAAEFAKRLAAWLRSEGYDPWLDVENGIPIGAPFDIRIESGIAESEFFIALLSPWSLRPEGFCRNELLFAQAKKVPIIPVRIAAVDPPIQIISLNFLDVANDPESAFGQLPAAIEQVRKTGKSQMRDWPELDAGRPWWTTLSPLKFEEELSRHGGTFVGRKWLFDEIGEWIRGAQSRLLLVTADPGVGKSAIAAQMTARWHVRGVHFCSSTVADSCYPKGWISGLVYQLAAQLPRYRARIERLSEPKWDEPATLFRMLIADPLRGCQSELDVREPWVFVVDGLDESVAVAGSALAELVADSAERVPDWLRLIVTSRPDDSLVAMFRLDGARRRHLDATGGQNMVDVANYVAERVRRTPSHVVPEAQRDALASRLASTAAGNFLFARMTLDALNDPDPEYRLSADEVVLLPGAQSGLLPRPLNGFYHAMFRKRFRAFDRYETELRPLLDCLAVARAPLPEALLVAASGLQHGTARSGLLALSQFLNRSAAGLSFFHRSIADWLTDTPASAPYSIDAGEGHGRLADACLREFQLENMSDYGRAHLPTHLLELRRWEDLLLLVESRGLALIERWVEHGEGDMGLKCLVGLIEHDDLEPVYRAALATQVARIHTQRGEYEEAEDRLQYALARTSWRRGRRTRAVALHELGSLYLYRGQNKRAARAYRRALRLCVWGWPAYRDEAAANRLCLAAIAFQQYRWRRALRLAQRGFREADSVGDFRHAIAALRLIGWVLEDLGRYEIAQSYLERALAASKDAGVDLEQARLLAALGSFHHGQAALRIPRSPSEAAEHLAKAQDLLRKALDVAERVHSLYRVLDTKLRLAWCALAKGRTAEAEACLRHVEACVPPDTHPELLVGVRVGFAAALHQRGRLEEAVKLYKDAAEVAEKKDFRGWATVALVGQGAVAWHSSRRQEAEVIWRRARRLAKRTSLRARQLTDANIGICRKERTATPC